MARILIVDDEKSNVGILSLVVSNMGHEPVKAYSGKHAINIVATKPPNLVLLDFMMPGINGRQTFLALKQINSDVRVLLASGYSVDQEAEAALQAGAVDFLQKPFRMRELSQRLVAAAQAEPPTS